jgi:hypothetical protein
MKRREFAVGADAAVFLWKMGDWSRNMPKISLRHQTEAARMKLNISNAFL